MLELVNVAKTYESAGDEKGVAVLRDITFKLEKGRSLVIVGPSGSGKSTLLNIIGTLDRPSSGRVLFDGKDLASLSDIELAAFRNRQIGFVFQMHHLLPQCTVLENVMAPTLAQRRGSSMEGARERAVVLLERVGLGALSGRRPGELSGGQRQRVALVRAFINRPSLLLADEPTGSLDQESSQNIADLLVELNHSEDVTMIVVTHSVQLADRVGHVMELNGGLLTDRSLR